VAGEQTLQLSLRVFERSLIHDNKTNRSPVRLVGSNAKRGIHVARSDCVVPLFAKSGA
jgi:hypothetical protein